MVKKEIQEEKEAWVDMVDLEGTQENFASKTRSSTMGTSR
jgi:hypothetical protein